VLAVGLGEKLQVCRAQWGTGREGVKALLHTIRETRRNKKKSDEPLKRQVTPNSRAGSVIHGLGCFRGRKSGGYM
jgi:hypothetical protein